MGMRAQVSLQFDDKDLFENMVLPFKEQKTLNGTIIKCLTAYYYDETVRNAVEGASSDTTLNEANEKTQALLNDIRNSLIMQDYCVSELEQAVASGTEDLEGILHRTNDELNKRGVVTPSDSDFGAGVGVVQSDGVKMITQNPSKTVVPTNVVEILVEAIKMLAISTGNNEVISLFSEGSKKQPEAETQVEPENTSLGDNSKVGLSNSEESEFTDEVKVEESDFTPDEVVKNTVERPVEPKTNGVVHQPSAPVVAPPPVIKEPKVEQAEDASAAVGALLDSLFG